MTLEDLVCRQRKPVKIINNRASVTGPGLVFYVMVALLLLMLFFAVGTVPTRTAETSGEKTDGK